MRRLLLWGPVALQMLLIFGASSMSDPGPLPGNMSDKTGHFLGYALLGVLVLRALARGRFAGITLRTAILAILISSAYGATDEFHQRYVAGRTPDVMDLLADACGASAGVALGGVARAASGLFRVAAARRE